MGGHGDRGCVDSGRKVCRRNESAKLAMAKVQAHGWIVALVFTFALIRCRASTVVPERLLAQVAGDVQLDVNTKKSGYSSIEQYEQAVCCRFPCPVCVRRTRWWLKQACYVGRIFRHAYDTGWRQVNVERKKVNLGL